jgi:branched-chain amino acid transport system permease protein
MAMTALQRAEKASPPISKQLQTGLNEARTWTVEYIVKPIAQILWFVFISALILSLLAIAVGFILRTPWHGIDILKTRPRIDLLRQVIVQLPNTLIDGITIGFVYAVIALGYTMVYGVLQFVNFAHSEIFMVGGVVGFEILTRLKDAQMLADFNPVLLIIFVLFCAMLVSGLLAVTVERFAYKPLRNAPRLVPLISAIGVSFLLQDIVRIIEDLSRGIINMPYPTDSIPALSQRYQFAINLQSTAENSSPLIDFKVSTNVTALIVVVSAIVILVGLNYFVNATRIGKAIRAVSQDQATASLMGINVNQMISLTFLVGGALGGAAGVLFGLKTTLITPYVGFIPGLKAFTAAVLGGIGNITGAVLGGILLGLLEAFASSLLPYFPALGTNYSNIFAFAVLILILIFRPAGLLGKRIDEKV